VSRTLPTVTPQPGEDIDRVLAWYATARRDLPWRRDTDPYRILVAEVMLQQTQAGRVIGHYTRWLARWPRVDDLALATPAEVITAWSGLGYNRRAVRLHQAARIIATQGWPDTAAGLRELPGIGPYTAAAVSAFAFGASELPVDVNVRRVSDRAFGGRLPAPPPGRAGDLAQALFDLGATICISRRPRCQRCPLESRCPSAGHVFAAQRRQPPFRGSRRQRRGELLRAAQAAPVPLAEANREVAHALVRDGLLEIRGDTLTLPALA
jgi:A/G-specific adenine glycosylase